MPHGFAAKADAPDAAVHGPETLGMGRHAAAIVWALHSLNLNERNGIPRTGKTRLGAFGILGLVLRGHGAQTLRGRTP